MKKVVVLVAVFVVMGIAAASALPSTSQAIVSNGLVRVQALSDALIRIEAKGPMGFEDRSTFVVVGTFPSFFLND